MFCFSCGNQIEDGSTICPYCGANQDNEFVRSRMMGYKQSKDGRAEIHLKNGTIIRDRFEIVDLIGRGGFCFTYKAYDRVLGVDVAIKEYFPHGVASREGGNTVTVFTEQDALTFDKGKKRFLREARGLAQFKEHPNVVSIYDFFEDFGTAYIVMEYLRGRNLREYLKEANGPLSDEFVYELARRVCDTLSDVHAKGIIHRDISPDNIFYCDNGNVKLIDFGALNQQTHESSDTVTVILKQGFAPVEQYYKDGKQGPWTDIYALGATLYNLSTGRVPQESVARMEQDNLVAPHNINPRLSKNFSIAIMKAMSISKQDRFKNTKDFKKALFDTTVYPKDYYDRYSGVSQNVSATGAASWETVDIFEDSVVRDSINNPSVEQSVYRPSVELSGESKRQAMSDNPGVIRNNPVVNPKDSIVVQNNNTNNIVIILGGIAAILVVIAIGLAVIGMNSNRSKNTGKRVNTTNSSTVAQTTSDNNVSSKSSDSSDNKAKTESTTEEKKVEESRSDGIGHTRNGICILEANLWGMTYDSVTKYIQNKGYKFSLDAPSEWWGESEDGGSWDGTGVKMQANWIDIDMGSYIYTYGFFFEDNQLVAVQYEDKSSSYLSEELLQAASEVFYEDKDWEKYVYTYSGGAKDGDLYSAYFDYTADNKYINDNHNGEYVIFSTEYDEEISGTGTVYAVCQVFTSDRFSGRAIFTNMHK